MNLKDLITVIPLAERKLTIQFYGFELTVYLDQNLAPESFKARDSTGFEIKITDSENQDAACRAFMEAIGIVLPPETKFPSEEAFGNCEKCTNRRCAIWFCAEWLLCRSCREVWSSNGKSI